MTIQVDLSLHTGNDYTAAFNAAFATARTSPDIVQLPPGTFGVTSINATNLQGVEIYGAGRDITVLNPLASQSCAVLDLSSSLRTVSHGFTIRSNDSTIRPMAGMVFTNLQGGKASTENKIRDVGIEGPYTAAPLLQWGTGDNVVRDSQFMQMYNGGTNVAAIAFSSYNVWGMTSLYGNVVTGYQHTSDLTFDGVEAHDLSVASGGSSINAVLSNAVSVVRWIGGLSQSSNCGFRFQNSSNFFTIVGIESYSENGTPPVFHFFSDDGSGIGSHAYINPAISAVRDGGAVIAVANGGTINGLTFTGAINSASNGALSGKKLIYFLGGNVGTYNSLNESRIDANYMQIDLTGGGSITHTQISDPSSVIVNSSNTNGASIY